MLTSDEARALDRQLAVGVMVYKYPPGTGDSVLDPIPHYSTHPLLALMVVDELMRQGHKILISGDGLKPEMKWMVRVGNAGERYYADNLPEAICLAALSTCSTAVPPPPSDVQKQNQ
jgi:hypothetical protein